MKNKLLKIKTKDEFVLDALLSTPDDNHKKLVLFVNRLVPYTYNTPKRGVLNIQVF